MIVKFHFDAQFIGRSEVLVDGLPDNITDNEIISMFPEVLGLEYDNNCWFERIF